MKKRMYSIFSAAMLLSSSLFAQPFTTVGNVSVSPSPGGEGRTYTLTQSGPCSGTLVSSAVWSGTGVDFTKSFDLLFNGRFTVPSGTGADGFVAVFGSNITATSLNVGGGYMGYYNQWTVNPDFNQSIGIEVDIFNNLGVVSDPTSPYVDHIMGAMNGDHTTLISGSTAPVQADPSVTSIKDGVYRPYQISWDCQAQILTVYCNGSLRFSTAFNPATAFATASSVPWGFTSATGSYCSTTDIDNPRIVYGKSCALSCDFPIQAIVKQDKCNVTVDIPAGQIPAGFVHLGYEVKWGDGTNNIYTTATPPPYTHTYASSGVYTILVEAIVFNPQTGECCRSRVFRQLIDVVCSDADGFMKNNLGLGDDNEGYFGSSSEIEVYPNPSQDKLNVSSKYEINSLSVYDLSGKEVYTAQYKAASNVTIDTRTLANGVYIIKMLDDKGNISKVKFEVKK